MTVHLVTFADELMSRSVELCMNSACRNGVDTDPMWWRPENLKGDPILTAKPADPRRAIGYWSWKPYIIDKALNGSWAKSGDTLIYSDAGVEFINNVSHIIDRMDQDILLFGNNWEHAHWCKRDVIEAIWPNRLETQGGEAGGHYNVWRHFGKQVQASVIFFRISDYTRTFVAEWLKWCLHRERYSTICTDEWRYLIDDSPSIAPNHPEFREHRHDQAILTTMAYREGIKLHWWPSIYNDGAFTYEKLPEYAGDDYPILFHHHRRRNHEWGQVA